MAVTAEPQQFRLNDAVNRHHADWQATQLAIQDALSRTGYRELDRVGVKCDGGTVTIFGRVPTFYLKQLAHCVAVAAVGGGQVSNQLDVC